MNALAALTTGFGIGLASLGGLWLTIRCAVGSRRIQTCDAPGAPGWPGLDLLGSPAGRVAWSERSPAVGDVSQAVRTVSCDIAAVENQAMAPLLPSQGHRWSTALVTRQWNSDPSKNGHPQFCLRRSDPATPDAASQSAPCAARIHLALALGQVVRLSLAAAGFYAVSREGPGFVLPALAGFWIARRILICTWGGFSRAE